MLLLPYIAVCCGQDPVFVNQGPATEVLARGALNGHDVSDGVRRRDVSTHDTALYHIITWETNQQTRELTDSISKLSFHTCTLWLQTFVSEEESVT